jgi:hypothetical protein
VSLADELLKLEQLRASEALSAQEFEDAKRALLYPPSVAPPSPVPPPVSGALNRSANEYFERQNRAADYRIIWNVIVAVVFIIIVLTVIGR